MKKLHKFRRVTIFIMGLVLLQYISLQNSLALGEYKSSEAQKFNKEFTTVNASYRFDFVLLPAAVLVVAAGVVVAGVVFVAGVVNCINQGSGHAVNSTQMQLASMAYASNDFSSFDAK